jgi:hypothetical protein
MKDPAVLLARGYTARYLGAVLQVYNKASSSCAVTTLSAEEIDRDLRHITAYQEAASRYQQLTYAVTNHIPMHAKDAPATESSAADVQYATAALPVRIDPEEEKRRITMMKRIQRAELVREELEQNYVALRAHYVVTTQELQQRAQESERTLEHLQSTVATTAALLGVQRARLQMTRDMAIVLRRRQEAAPETDGAVDSDPFCPLLAAWTAVEEEWKRHVAVMKGGATTTKGGKASKAASGQIIPWLCTQEPSTAPGIPMLLSVLSTKPEKSIAIQTGGMFGSHKHTLTWLESHLPEYLDEDTIETERDDMEQLRSEVQQLERELYQERQVNQEVWRHTAQARARHDEWVAMTSLVRQETEAVLHRHNVLLDSDEVQEAIQAAALAASLQAEAETKLEELPDADIQEDEAKEPEPEEDAHVSSRHKDDADEEEGASEADDEGMEEEGEEVEDTWDTNQQNKRGVGEEETFAGASPGGSRKRRKL